MYAIQMLIFEKHFFSNGEFEFPGTQLSFDEYLSSAVCGYGFQEKIAVGIAWSQLLCTGVARCSNVFVPSVHSEGELRSQVPGQTCGPHELVKPATRSNTDNCLLSLRLTSQCHVSQTLVKQLCDKDQ